MAGRVPGATCQLENPQHLDAGTLCRAASPLPGSTGLDQRDPALDALDQALAALQAEAETFAWRYLNDAQARRIYVARIGTMAAQMRRDVVAGLVSAGDGARFANGLREQILQEVRALTSAIGRAKAEAAKLAGPTLEEAIDKAVRKLFPGKTFNALGAAERRAVFVEVIEASGRSSPKFTNQIPRWTRWGRSLAVVTVAISAYHIWAAENKLRQGALEGATLLGGALGGAAANASAGLLCGPAAPGCVTALFVIGGIAGALLAGAAADTLLDQKDVVAWLGE